MITFTIPGKPLPLDRARHGKGKVYDTDRNKNAKIAIGWSYHNAIGPRKPIDGPVRLKLAFMFDWPASYTKKRKQV